MRVLFVKAKYNIRLEDEITKIENNTVSFLEAAFVIIVSMGLYNDKDFSV